MPTPEIIEKLRHAYRQWHDTRGESVAVWMELLADEVSVRSIAEGGHGLKFSAPRKGKSAVESYFRDIASDWEMVYYHADEFIADGDRVVMVGRCAWKHRGTGKTAESAVTHLWRFRDGQAIEFFEFFDSAAAAEAATPDPK